MQIIPISQWSASKAKTSFTCKLRAKLRYGQKIPEPERALKPGQTEHANDRGTRIHLTVENYVQGKGPFASEMTKLHSEVDSLKQLYSDGMVSLEGEWAMSKEWEAVPWASKAAWLRLKLDAIVFLSDYEAVVVDYKSGRKFGNEISHAEQVQLYQLVAFLRYPKLEIVHTELWYPDVAENDLITQNTFIRKQGLRFKAGFHNKGMAITTRSEERRVGKEC